MSKDENRVAVLTMWAQKYIAQLQTAIKDADDYRNVQDPENRQNEWSYGRRKEEQ